MKRYFLFVWDSYYPSGGMKDFRGDFDDGDAAIAEGNVAITDGCMSFFQVYDTVENREVAFEYKD